MHTNPAVGPESVVSSVLDLIANTPMVELGRIRSRLKLDGRLLAKCEQMSPGGSKKDRIALHIVRTAKTEGRLAAGQPVVEVTSGNTGTGLAIVCRALGHPFIAVMSAGNSRERAQQMRALGAEVVVTPQVPGATPGLVSGQDLELVRAEARRILAERGGFFADQFATPANAAAHSLSTAPEMWRQSGGTIDVFLDFAGTGGSFAGCMRYFRSMNPTVRGYIVEPAAATTLATCSTLEMPHAIQGGGYGMPSLTQMEGCKADGYLSCSDQEAIAGARMLAAEEGLFAGFSAGAHLHAAIELLRGQERGRTIAFLVCDTGLKYLSTELF
jgi:cysteine synthase A